MLTEYDEYICDSCRTRVDYAEIVFLGDGEVCDTCFELDNDDLLDCDCEEDEDE